MALGIIHAAIGAFLLAASQVFAASFEEFSLKAPNCKIFSVGESGHSERCAGPAGYRLIFHYRRSRIDLEIARPGKLRGVRVHRLSDYLGDGQRHFLSESIRWHVVNDLPVVFIMDFAVEPRAYEAPIPLSLIFRVAKGQGEGDCPIATISQGSRITIDEVISMYQKRACRPAFPQ